MRHKVYLCVVRHSSFNNLDRSVVWIKDNELDAIATETIKKIEVKDYS